MPIQVESDRWNGNDRIDILEVEAERYLQRNSDKAYTPAEITEYLTAEKSKVFPETLLSEGTRVSRIVLVTSRLEKLVWHDRVEVRALDSGLYYTNSEGGRFPIAEVEQEIPDRFVEIERKLAEITDELNNVRTEVRDLEE